MGAGQHLRRVAFMSQEGGEPASLDPLAHRRAQLLHPPNPPRLRHVEAHGRQVDLVDRAPGADAVAERTGYAMTICREPIGGRRRVPAARLGDPQWRREVMQGDDGHKSRRQGRVRHPRVVVERRARHQAVLRLDPRPLHGKPVGVEPQLAQQPHVVGIAMIVVDGVAGRLCEPRGAPRQGLQQPDVAMDVATLHLVRGGGRAPQETLALECGHTLASFSPCGGPITLIMRRRPRVDTYLGAA
jgi:hypothetical protein